MSNNTMVKDGYFYRRKKGGGPMLRIRKKEAPGPKFSPDRVQRLIRNPGTRAQVPTNLLPAHLRQQRRLNRRLDSPVIPGSSLTNRQVAQQSRNYMTVKYGAGDLAERQALAAQQGTNANTGGWYDEYLRSLQQHAQNVGAFTDQSVQQTRQIGGMNGQQVLGHQGDAISQGVNAQAQAVRDDRAGSWVGQLAAQGAARKTLASAQANVVGPQQKLEAMATGARKLSKMREDAKLRADTKKADEANFRAGLVSDEVKNQTALAIAQGRSDTAITTAKIRAQAGAGKGTPPVPWYTWAQWKSLSPAEKRAAVKDYKKSSRSSSGSGTTTKLAPDKIHTMDEWLAATPQQRKAWLRAAKGSRSGSDAVEVKAQKRFEYAYSFLGKKASEDNVKLTAQFIRRNATALVNQLCAETKISRPMARRVLSAWIKNRGGDPGSFKDYGKPGAPAVPTR